jgi:predicted RNA-binding Zn-ribbon protein involved in translation (DUF1610 family)
LTFFEKCDIILLENKKGRKIMDILTALDIISGYLDLCDFEDMADFSLACKAEDVLYNYVYEKEGINMSIQKYFVCKHCGKQLLNENLFVKGLANENEFHCEDCGKVYIIENETVIEEDAQ